MWLTLPPELRASSLLAVTGADRMSQRNLDKVLARGRRETKDLFASILPIASLRAMEAVKLEKPEEAAAAWTSSGAQAVTEAIALSASKVNRSFKVLADLVMAEASETQTKASDASSPEARRSGSSLGRAPGLFAALRAELGMCPDAPTDDQLQDAMGHCLALIDRDEVGGSGPGAVLARVVSLGSWQGRSGRGDPARGLSQIGAELSDFECDVWCDLDGSREGADMLSGPQ